MDEKESQARALLDKTNRQFNECNALYHAAAQRCGLSDAAFWTLYALVTSCEPLTQNRIAADWGIPKQTLNSAVANAENQHHVRPESLVVKAAYVDEGPTLKRIRPRAKGSASRSNKRTSHITIIVAPREEA